MCPLACFPEPRGWPVRVREGRACVVLMFGRGACRAGFRGSKCGAVWIDPATKRAPRFYNGGEACRVQASKHPNQQRASPPRAPRRKRGFVDLPCALPRVPQPCARKPQTRSPLPRFPQRLPRRTPLHGSRNRVSHLRFRCGFDPTGCDGCPATEYPPVPETTEVSPWFHPGSVLPQEGVEILHVL